MSMNRILPIPEEMKESIRRFAEQVTGWQVQDTHIKKIKVHAFSGRVKKPIDSEICVGQELDCNLSNIPHEPVLAIFESHDEYLVVTPDRNKSDGTVYFFEPNEVQVVEKEDS